ncbi:MAG: 50S ribosome-binding GTPase [Methanoculleus sp.]|nr:50S ribosome-binding GTPase [Methanoculleus sp.]MDD3917692.1 FeoB small GTPase domain-containing protein [Synergistaceae bacterium]
MTKKIRIALTGNPGAGKAEIFAALTGNRSRVPTEKKTGRVSHNGYDVEIVDLPETCSLTAYSAGEIIVRDFILDETPDVVVQAVDAANLERDLYLTTRLAELGVPVVIALNVADVIDPERLSAFLEIPVVCTARTRGDGREDLLDAAIREVETAPCHERIMDYVDYGAEVETMIASLIDLLLTDRTLTVRYPLRWLAVRLLEGDEDALARIPCGLAFNRLQDFLSLVDSDEYRAAMVERRYEAIAAILPQVLSPGTGVPAAPCRCPGWCGNAGDRLVVEYVLTEKGREAAGRLAKMGRHIGLN